MDAHVTPPAANAIGNGQMVLIMGTSTCHVMNGATLAEVPGMCGVVDGGIVAGRFGYEAGQTGVGDIFAWVADHATPPAYHDEAARRGMSVHDLLSAEAAAQPAGAHGLLALDWLNGNRVGARRSSPLRCRGWPNAGDPRTGHLPGDDRVHRVRHPRDHRCL